MLLLPIDIEKKLHAFRGWEYVDKKIQKTYRLPNFIKAVEVVNKLAVIAESLGHHPDILIHDYNQLTIITYTHTEQGVTDKDIQLAKEVEKHMALEV